MKQKKRSRLTFHDYKLFSTTVTYNTRRYSKMLIPRCELTQTDAKVFITIYAPYANVAESEVYVDGDDFRFLSKPYYLRLKLPGEVLEMGNAGATYEADDGKFVITLEKAVPGETFPNLNLISTLLVKRTKQLPTGPSIIAADCDGEDSDNDDCCISEFDEAVIDLNEDTADKPEEDRLTPLLKPKYGFANKYSNSFQGFTYEVAEIFDLPNPDVTPASHRAQLRKEREKKDFSEDHYLADYFNAEVMEDAMKYIVPWEKDMEEMTSLDAEDFDQMKNIASHGWVLRKKKFISLGLVDILLAYCYDHRTTEGDPTSESAWTINKLSSTLCWCEKFRSLKDVVIAFVRRSLCYPLFRNWELSLRIVKDVQLLLRHCKLYLQKCLLQIHRLFNASEPRYLLNRIFIDDYCHWIAHVDSSDLTLLAEEIGKMVLKKEDVELELVQLESAGLLVLEQSTENDFNEITSDMSKIKISKEEKKEEEKEEEEEDDDDEDDQDSSSGDLSDDEYYLDSDDFE